MFKAIAMSALELTGQEGCKAFDGEHKGKVYCYTNSMNEIAGKEITLEEYSGANGYDYEDAEGNHWRKDWLKNIREEREKGEEVDWSTVAVDTKVVITLSNGGKSNRYFAKFENGKVWTWEKGATSWSASGFSIGWHSDMYLVTLWKEDE